jgi:hypothetical protein
MGVRPADVPLADVQMIIHQQDERIVRGKVFRGDHLRRQMSRSDESGRERWGGDRASNPALRDHGGLPYGCSIERV